MKVLHIINNLGPGGAEKLIEELLPLMNEEKNINVDLLILTDKNNVFYESVIERGIDVKIIKYRNIYDVRNILEIKKYIQSEEYDVVHTHLFPTLYWTAIASKLIFRNKPKFIYTEHSNHNRRREKKIFKYIDKLIYKQYDTIISITEKVEENLLEWIDSKRKKRNKYIVVENGINIESIKKASPYKKKDLIDGITEDIRLICMVGRFSEAKDQQTIIRAMELLADDIHLILVGEGPLIGANKKLTKELELDERIHFLGFRQDIPRILKTVDIVVLSSHWEGLSLASIEGLASGKAFVASRVPGLEEIVSGYGLLFEEGDYKEFTEVILKLLNNNDFYNEVKNNCLKRAKDYTIESMLERTVSVYFKQM